MKFAKLKSSKRLQRVLAVLADGQEHSTRDIVHAADVCAVNSIIAELRANGVSIACKRKSRNIFIYRVGG